MTLTAFFILLASVFMHVSWNFLCKSKNPSPGFMLVVNVITALCCLPFLFMMKIQWGTLPAMFWVCLGISILANVMYCTTLALAYRYGDISVSYPLSRSIPVLLTAIATMILHIGKTPSSVALVGLFILFLGCVFLPQTSIRSLSPRNFANAAMIPILLSALGTTTYTISDNVSTALFAEHTMSSHIITCGTYFFLLQLGISVIQGNMLYFLFPLQNRLEIRKAFSEPFAYLAGFLNFGAYFLVLISMRYVTNVSFVQAFRQMGLPLGVFAGIYFLHEKLTYMKVLGIIMIVLGLVLSIL